MQLTVFSGIAVGCALATVIIELLAMFRAYILMFILFIVRHMSRYFAGKA